MVLADGNVEEEEEVNVMRRLVECDIPEEFRIGKPQLFIVNESTTL